MNDPYLNKEIFRFWFLLILILRLSDNADVVVGKNDGIWFVVSGFVRASHGPERSVRISLRGQTNVHPLHLSTYNVQIVFRILQNYELKPIIEAAIFISRKYLCVLELTQVLYILTSPWVLRISNAHRNLSSVGRR